MTIWVMIKARKGVMWETVIHTDWDSVKRDYAEFKELNKEEGNIQVTTWNISECPVVSFGGLVYPEES